MKIQGTVNKYPQQLQVGAEILVKLGRFIRANPKKEEIEGANFAKVIKIEETRVRERFPARKLTLDDGVEVTVLTIWKVIVKE